MAIVREKVEKLGGQIAIDTERGAGTTVPHPAAGHARALSRASSSARAGNPSSSRPRCSSASSACGATTSIRWRTARRSCSTARPSRLRGSRKCSNCRPRRRRRQSDAMEVIVARHGGAPIGFAVETVMNEQEVLVKSLGAAAAARAQRRRRHHPRLRHAGAHPEHGRGPVSPPSASQRGAPARRTAAPQRRRRRRPLAILVADDSVTSRMLVEKHPRIRRLST